MISVSASTVNFNNQFSIEITVYTVDAVTGAQVPVTEIPQVNASFVDTSVVVETSIATVTISGKYTDIFTINWTWLDQNKILQVTTTPPAIGEFYKIIQVDSPNSVSEDCIYTITTSQTSDTFTHTVSLPDYSAIGNLLNSLLTEAL